MIFKVFVPSFKYIEDIFTNLHAGIFKGVNNVGKPWPLGTASLPPFLMENR